MNPFQIRIECVRKYILSKNEQEIAKETKLDNTKLKCEVNMRQHLYICFTEELHTLKLVNWSEIQRENFI